MQILTILQIPYRIFLYPLNHWGGMYGVLKHPIKGFGHVASSKKTIIVDSDGAINKIVGEMN